MELSNGVTLDRQISTTNRKRTTTNEMPNDCFLQIFVSLVIFLQGEFLDGSATQLCRRSKVSLIDLAGSEKAKNVSSNEANMNPEAANSRLKVYTPISFS